MPVTSGKHDIFAAIADPTRRAILLRLARDGQKTVTEILEPFPISQPGISKHLRCLRRAGLVRCRARGRTHLYEIDGRSLRQVHDWVSQFQRYWDNKLDALGDYLNKKSKGRNPAA